MAECDRQRHTTLVCLVLGLALVGLGTAGVHALAWGARAGLTVLCVLLIVFGVLCLGAAFADDPDDDDEG